MSSSAFFALLYCHHTNVTAVMMIWPHGQSNCQTMTNALHSATAMVEITSHKNCAMLVIVSHKKCAMLVIVSHTSLAVEVMSHTTKLTAAITMAHRDCHIQANKSTID